MRSFHRLSSLKRLHFPVARLALALALVAQGCSEETGGEGGGSTAGTGGAGQGGAGDGGDVASTSAPSSSSVTNTIAAVASSSASTGTGGIFCATEYANFPQSDECDLLQQNCEPGFTCDRARVGGETVTRCEPRSGLKGVGSSCDDERECEVGLFCVFDVCTPVCCDTNDEPCEGGTCNLLLGFPPTEDTILVCTYSKACEPLTEDACPSGSGCHFEEPNVSSCIQGSGENVPEGGNCEAINDCRDMQQCSPSEDVCRWICALEDNGMEPGLGGCPAGQSCVATPAIEAAGIGICRAD